jgi:ABC-2 type transport system permease protein
MDSLKKVNTILATPLSLNLEDQLFNYGVRVNNDLIQDLRAAPIPVVSGQYGNQVQTELFPWLYFPLIISKNNHPINKNINIVKAEFASSIDLVGSSNLKKTVILSSSDKTKLVKAPTRVSLNMLRFEPDVAQFKKKNIPLAVLVEGEFNSLFENRLPPNIENAGTIKFKAKSPDTKQLFIGDGSMIENKYKEETNEYFAMGMDSYTKQVYGNKDFFLNAVNYMLNDSDLILAKSKSFKIRLLDKEQIQENKLLIQVINIGIPIFSIVLLGLILTIYRRKKYSN